MSSKSAPHAASNLRRLLSLVNESAEDAIRQYEQAGVVPALDTIEPLELPVDSLALKRTLRIFEAASYQLASTLVPPMLAMYTHTTTAADIVCTRIAVNKRIADILHGHKDGLHIKDLAHAAGLNNSKLLRVMRVLASKHCFREVMPECFANNALSVTLREEHPVWSNTYVRLNYMDPIGLDNLYNALSDPEYADSFEPNKSAFAYGIRQEIPGGKFFDWVERHPEFSTSWQRGLTALSPMTDADTIITHLPWRDMPQNTSICDVGSGIGLVSLSLAVHHPHLCLTLQDRPHVLQQAELIWQNKNPTATVHFVPLDFFNEAPVGNQDIYYLRQILHDWPTGHCISILENIRAAMTSTSRLYIHEYILSPPVSIEESDDQPTGIEKAPSPLLPNYGYGSHRGYFQDLYMLSLFNAKERTVEEFKEIGERAGLRFVKVWELSATGVIEFSLG